MKSNTECDCMLGFLSDDRIYRSNLDFELERTTRVQSQFYEMGLSKYKPLKAKEILDNRRGFFSRFTYCPYCGEKFNWKNIINNYIE